MWINLSRLPVNVLFPCFLIRSFPSWVWENCEILNYKLAEYSVNFLGVWIQKEVGLKIISPFYT